jgi:hypothetical protein
MYAYKPQRTAQATPQPTRKLRRRPRQRQQQQSRREQAIFIELGIKTSVNCLFIGVAIVSIANLLPHHLSQQEKLAEIQVEVSEAEYRVNKLRHNFNTNFDAYESQKLTREHSEKVDPLEKRVIWVAPE